ncbi:osteoclast-associated immunoglobulin-like receptor [Porphyrio hochstetteri]
MWLYGGGIEDRTVERHGNVKPGGHKGQLDKRQGQKRCPREGEGCYSHMNTISCDEKTLDCRVQIIHLNTMCRRFTAATVATRAGVWNTPQHLTSALDAAEAQLEPRTEGAKRDVMLPVTHVLAFGAWLSAQSNVTASAPTISIFLKPPGVIPPGGSTTICCSYQGDRGNFVLYKDGQQVRTLTGHGSRAEFPISNATQEDIGVYNCHYLEGGTVLARSETLDIKVQEFQLPQPVLSVLPGCEVAAGAHVAFRCTIAHSAAVCFLYLEGQIEVLTSFSKEQNYFNLSHVHKGNEGRYSCQCFTGGTLFQWSACSNTLDLAVRDYTWTNVVRLALVAGVLVLMGLIVAEATCSHRSRPGLLGHG